MRWVVLIGLFGLLPIRPDDWRPSFEAHLNGLLVLTIGERRTDNACLWRIQRTRR